MPSSMCCPRGEAAHTWKEATASSRKVSACSRAENTPRRLTQPPRLVETVTSGDVVTTPVGELAPRPPNGGEDPPEALLGGEPLPPRYRKRLGDGHRRDFVAAIPGFGKGHAGDVLLQNGGGKREAREPLPLRPAFDAVPASQLVHLLHAHQAGVVVLVAGERQPVALDRVGDEAGGLVAVGGRLERFHHRLDVMTGQIRHQPREPVVVELVKDRPHSGDPPEILREALAPCRAALEHHRRVEGVRTVVDPLPERVAAGTAEHSPGAPCRT